MNGTESMALYEAKKARRVYLYRNGSKQSEPKCMVLNEKHIRDFGTFLSRVTSGLRAPVAIRNIYTPTEGHVVNTLTDLEANHYYVAGGSEQFKKVQYGYRKKDLQQVPRKKITFNDSTFHKAATTSRYKLPPNRPIVIHIYRNGNAYSGKRVLIPSNIVRSRDHVLELVTAKAQLFTPAKRLCTLDGKPVEVSEIENGGKYVAMEGSKAFQKVSYSILEDRLSLPPSLSRRTFSKASIQARPVARSEKGLKRKSVTLVKGDVLGEQVLYSQPQPLKRKKSIRPMAGRKNKEGREKAINDLRSREDSINGGSPVQYLDESFRTENNLSVVYDQKSITPTSIPEESRQDFTDSTHLDPATAEQPLNDSSTSNDRGVAANAKTAPSKHSTAGTASGTSTPRESREARLRVPKDKTYSQVETRYRTEGSRSKQGSRDSRGTRQKKAGEPEEFQGISRSEKGVFYASNKSQYITAEYKDDEQGKAFKAKDKRTEVIGAETVQEGQETEVERPIAHLKAEVVEEEEGVQDDQESTDRKDGQDEDPPEESQQEENESSKGGTFQSTAEEVTEEQRDTEERAGEEGLLAAATGPSNAQQVKDARTSAELGETEVEEEEQETEDLHGEENYAKEQFEGDSSSAAEGQSEAVSKSGAGNGSIVEVAEEESPAECNNESDEPAQNGENAGQKDITRPFTSESTQNSDATLQAPTESNSRTPPPRSSPIATQE